MKNLPRLGTAAFIATAILFSPAYGSSAAVGEGARVGGTTSSVAAGHRVVRRFVPPQGGGGPMTPAEMPGSSNPSEPYAGATLPVEGSITNGATMVNPLTGLLSLTFTDLRLTSRGTPGDLNRTYNSFNAGVDGPLGRGWSFSFGMHLEIRRRSVTVAQENGSQITFTLSNGQYAAAPRVLAHLKRMANGAFELLRGSTTATCPAYARRTCTSFEFSSTGRLMEYEGIFYVITPSGRKFEDDVIDITLRYKSGRLVRVVDRYGRVYKLHYANREGNGGSGRITSITFPDGNDETFSYRGGNLVKTTTPGGAVTRFAYDSRHRMTSETDPRGGVISFQYNPGAYEQRTFRGWVIVETDQNGNRTTFDYSPGSTRVTNPAGREYVVQYRESDLLRVDEGSVEPPLASWRFTYDPETLGVTSITDPNGGLTTASYDDQGNLISSTDPLGFTSTRSYDSTDQTTTVTDAMGVATTTAYDVNGNVISQSTPLVGSGQRQTVTFAYGDGQHSTDLTSMTDPNGKVWRYSYDAFDDLTSSIDPMGDRTTYTYNIVGLLTSTTSPDGNAPGGDKKKSTTTVDFSKDYNVLARTDGLGGSTTYAYDASGNLTSQTDALGRTTQYGYDADGQLVSVSRKNITVTLFSRDDYNKDGTLSDVVDAGGNRTTYAYDQLGRLQSTTDPLGHKTTYGYDPLGNLTSTTRPTGVVTNYSYDADGRLIRTFPSDGRPPVTRGYDGDGRLISMTDGTGTTTVQFDSLGRQTSTTDGRGATVARGYDLGGNLTSLTYPNGKQVTQTYDAAGRPMSLTDWLGHTVTFSYDAGSNLTQTRFPSGNVDTYGYDPNGNLTSIQDSLAGNSVASFAYGRNALGQVTTATETGTGQGNQTYAYDNLGRLVKENDTPYTYDSRDNPTGLPSGAVQTYNGGGELTSVKGPSGSQTFTYDANGSRTSAQTSGGTGVAYGYDGAGNLISFTGATALVTYAYDGAGRLTASSSGGSTRRFVWDSVGDVGRLIQDGSTSYVYGPDGLPLEQIDGTNILYLHHDQLGSTRFVTNAAGGEVGVSSYDAYGNSTGQSGVQTPFGFAGLYTDPASGLVSTPGGGLYDPATAQFLTRDHKDGLAPPGNAQGTGAIGPPQEPTSSGLIIMAGVGVGYTYAKRAAIMDNQRKDVVAIKAYVEQAIARSQGPAGPRQTLDLGAAYSYAKRAATMDNQRAALASQPGGGDIFADRYGRVKVHFFWDRTGKADRLYGPGQAHWGRALQPAAAIEVSGSALDPYTYGNDDPVNLVGRSAFARVWPEFRAGR